MTRFRTQPVFNCFVLAVMAATCVLSAGMASAAGPLLFHLSGDNEFTADVAGGCAEPMFVSDVTIQNTGPDGPSFMCGNNQLFTYDAPGNVYAQRGTLAFNWRPREFVGKGPFPIFRVSYADNSSWDYVWLRMDWNGEGYEAFVTDINLARPRVSWKPAETPDPETWHHFAFSWDETTGIRLYVDGRKVGSVDTTAVFDASLDQFGPHHRIVSPYQVQSRYNYERGGDIDELCIYDRMLTDAEVANLAGGADPARVATPSPARNLTDSRWRDEWLLRYGWNRPGDVPKYLCDPTTSVRKVEIGDVYDLKQWMWKGTDGIRETTWPYVYNMSRIPGRWDYFTLPDWNCYSLSGKTVTFTMPDEPWNHIEIAGAAHGSASLLAFCTEGSADIKTPLFDRPAGQERTFHRFDDAVTGGKVQFTNVLQETPIGEFQAYHVSDVRAPAGTHSLYYSVNTTTGTSQDELARLTGHIAGRYLPDERQTVVALPGGAPRYGAAEVVTNPLPLVHVLIPYGFREGRQEGRYGRYSYTWANIQGGLDGIEIDIPALDVTPTHDGLFPLNIRVMDPIWPDRTLLDFTFAVKPGEARTLWLDTRDRVLPNDRSMYMTIASAGDDFTSADLAGTRLRLVFTELATARLEHEPDRFNQVKDNVGQFVEENPQIRKFRIFDRYYEDITDLFRVNPDHIPGRYYWTYKNTEQGWPAFDQPEPADSTPLWAFRQAEIIKKLREYLTWWIDERQIANGEFGGGISDDSDMTNQFPGPALMGIEPDKISKSLHMLLDASYEQGLFTDGLPTIVTDELHVYEEGINVQTQVMAADYGDPETIERMMETASAYERITGINDTGHRQIKSSFYGGHTIHSEGVWARSITNYSTLILQPGVNLVEFNGHPATRELVLEVYDGVLAASSRDDNGRFRLPNAILYPSGEGIGTTSASREGNMFWAAWKWTGDKKYLEPIESTGTGALGNVNANILDELDHRKDWGKSVVARTSRHSGSDTYRHIAMQMTGDLGYAEGYLADQLHVITQRMYMNTVGHWWIDRVSAETQQLQRSRLGGIALWRNLLVPGHYVSWKFHGPADPESMGIIIPDATPTAMTIIAHNMDDVPVTADLTGWNIEPGRWEFVQGVDTDEDFAPDTGIEKQTVTFERSKSVTLTFPPHRTTVLTLRRTRKGTPYWKRPDIGIGDKDVTASGSRVSVTVHSIGSVTAPASTVALVAADGSTLATADIPSLEAPLDFLPKTVDVTLTASSAAALEGAKVVLDPDGKLEEITEMNNEVCVR
jgi:hypothetical protein